MKHLVSMSLFEQTAAAAGRGWTHRVVRHKFFETGEGTAYYKDGEFSGLVYEMGNGEWVTLWADLDAGQTIEQMLDKLADGKHADWGTSAVSPNQKSAENEMTRSK